MGQPALLRGCRQDPSPFLVVVIQDTTKPWGYQLALVSTDLDASAAQLIERYAERWRTEVAYEEGKELAGVGQARNRAEKAMQRTVPFQFLAMSLTITWYALSGHHPADVDEHRERHPWYLTKTTASFADMLRKAPPRDHRLPISPRSGVRAHTPRNRGLRG